MFFNCNLRISEVIWDENHGKCIDCIIFRLNAEVMGLLGKELGGAHFIIEIGGAVKLSGKNFWIRKDIAGSYGLPRNYIDNVFVEGIDASHTDLLYDGMESIGRNL